MPASPADSCIHDVQVVPLRRIPDERGTIFHMLRCDDPHFRAFGEIYFASIHPGAIKGWHRHRDMTLNYACLVGTIKLVLHDDRERSPSRGQTLELFIGEQNYALVVIPPMIWTGFKAIGGVGALIANCATHPHDPSRSERISPFDPRIPYSWDIRHG